MPKKIKMINIDAALKENPNTGELEIDRWQDFLFCQKDPLLRLFIISNRHKKNNEIAFDILLIFQYFCIFSFPVIILGILGLITGAYKHDPESKEYILFTFDWAIITFAFFMTLKTYRDFPYSMLSFYKEFFSDKKELKTHIIREKKKLLLQSSSMTPVERTGKNILIVLIYSITLFFVLWLITMSIKDGKLTPTYEHFIFHLFALLIILISGFFIVPLMAIRCGSIFYSIIRIGGNFNKEPERYRFFPFMIYKGSVFVNLFNMIIKYTYLLFLGQLFLIIWMIITKDPNPLIIIAIGVLLFTQIYSFLVPTIMIHNGIMKIKAERLASLNEVISKKYNRICNSDEFSNYDSEDLDEIEHYHSIFRNIESTREWPFDFPTLIRILAPVAVTITSSVITYLLLGT